MEKILLTVVSGSRQGRLEEIRQKRSNSSNELPSDIPELSENCGTSQMTAVSVSEAWTGGGDLHRSITGGSVSRKKLELVKGNLQLNVKMRKNGVLVHGKSFTTSKRM